MLTSLLLLLLLVPDDAPTWVERIRKDPDEAQVLIRARDTAKLKFVIAAFFEAKDKKSLNALGWQAVAALPAKSEIGRRLEAHNLVAGVMDRACAPKRYEIVLGEGPKVKPRTVSLQWESGSGHGFTLERYRARWAKDGLHVRKMRYFRKVRTDDNPCIVTSSTVIPERRANVVLRMVFAATALKLQRRKSNARGFRSTFSSANFHRLLRVTADRPIFEKRYTGYPSTVSEPQYAALEVCATLLNELLEDCAWKTEQPNDADLSDLANRLKTLDTEDWWVKERLIQMAGVVGDKRCLPALKKCILAEPDKTERPHRYAINAYARISGVDLRPNPFGATEVAAVRAKYLAFFKRDRTAR